MAAGVLPLVQSTSDSWCLRSPSHQKSPKILALIFRCRWSDRRKDSFTMFYFALQTELGKLKKCDGRDLLSRHNSCWVPVSICCDRKLVLHFQLQVLSHTLQNQTSLKICEPVASRNIFLLWIIFKKHVSLKTLCSAFKIVLYSREWHLGSCVCTN